MTRQVLVVAVCVACLPTATWGNGVGNFLNEPADYWPDQWELPTGQWITNDWVTDPPYQRNIHFTFDNGLDLWTPVYYGTDDGTLDPVIVYPGTAFVWFDNDATFHFDGVARHFGLIGIDNRQGTDNVLSGIQVAIDNRDSPNEWKHLWKEIVFYAGPGFSEEEQLSVPDNFTVLDPQIVVYNDIGDNYMVLDVAYKVYPNPPWEQMTIIVHVPVGSVILVDEIHFATECVPEPATVTLALFGAGALAALRRRRRR